MATKHFIFSLPSAGILAGIAACAMLAACSSGGGADSLRATAQAAGVSVPAEQPTAQTIEQPAQTTPTPFPANPVRIVDAQQVEVTRIVKVTQPAQMIEVTHIVEATVEVPVIVTATPDIAGFQDAGIDESVQPCPIKYWKRGRCVATDAQIEAYASEVQP
jgi:hypothetical protein